MRTFIIIGLNPQGLSMLRILSRTGYSVVAFTNSSATVGYLSKYGDKRIFKDINDLERQIKEITGLSNEKIICIITSGVLLAMIIAEFPELYEICDVQSGPLSLLQILAHKNLMYGFASERGLKCAKYELLQEYKPGDLQFPVILKRNYEIPLFFKVKKLTSENELALFISGIKEEERRHVIIQEFISMNSFINVSYQAYYIKGNCKLTFISDQERRLNSGITSYIKEITDPFLLTLIRNEADKFFNGSGYSGFTELEFLYSPDSGELYFIEINTRTCGLHSVLTRKFKNIGILYENVNDPQIPEMKDSQVAWINMARDVRARFQNRDFRNLLQFFTSEHDIFDWHDLKPFILQFFSR